MKLMPSCHEVQTELTEYAEGTLPFGRRASIWAHLLLCRVCAGFLRGMKALPGISKAALIPPQETPVAATQALEQALAKLRKLKVD